jgi:hypothetical protein
MKEAKKQRSKEAKKQRSKEELWSTDSSGEKSGPKNQGRMSLSALAPSFNCAAKFLRLPGSIWAHDKSCDWTLQEDSNRSVVESCA